MAVFNCDDYLATLEKPTVVINGKTYVGQILSLPQWMPYAMRLEASLEGKSKESTLDFAKDFLYAVFPKKSVPFWRVDLKDEDDVVPQLLNHPGLLTILADLFHQEEKAIQVQKPTPMTTNGITSVDSPSAITE